MRACDGLALGRMRCKRGIVNDRVEISLIRRVHGAKISVKAGIFIMKAHQIFRQLSRHAKLGAAMINVHFFARLIPDVVLFPMRNAARSQKKNGIGFVPDFGPQLCFRIQKPV